MESIKKEDRQRNILLVDNDENLVQELKEWIKKADVERKQKLSFTFVSDAKDALKKLGELSIDVIILEVTLPLISGYHLIKAIRSTNKEIPILIYTRLKNPQDLAKMAGSSVNNIFLKQLMRPEDLIEILSKKGGIEKVDEIVMELSSQIKALHENANKAEMKLIQCPQCHMILAPDSHFCNNCGQKIFKKKKRILTQTEGEEGEKESEEVEEKVNQEETKTETTKEA